MTLFRRLSLATTLTTIGVIGVGALVRATGSGDGCPAWPKCFGRWIPPLEHHAIIEYSHRAIGAIAIVLLLITTVVALAKHRNQKKIWIPMVIAAPSILMQAALGAIVVTVKTHPKLQHFEPTLVTFHIATAMALVGLLVYATVNSYCLVRPLGLKKAVAPSLARIAIAAAAVTYLQILVGAYVRGEHAGLAFGDFPLMNGALIPPLHGLMLTHFLHRAMAVVVGIVVATFVARALRSGERALKIFAWSAAGLYVAQILVGGAQVWLKLAWPPVVAHVVLASLLWGVLVAAVTVSRNLARPPQVQPAHRELVPISGGATPELTLTRSRTSLRAYIALTKPRIIVLLLITTIPAMMLAARGIPSIWLMFATVLGGTMGAGAANALNMFLDRDIDAVMGRTRARPLPSHQVEPTRALVFAIALAAASFVFMTATVNLLAAILTQSAIVFYVFVYTIVLKRTTPQNIVIGGAAGAVPVLVGWAAVTGRVGIDAYVMFCIVFFWTPPHFWALAMRFSKDYEQAGVPMLPVVAGARETQRQIVLYSVVTVLVTLALYPVARMGLVYLVSAAVLGIWFIRAAVILKREGTPRAAMGLFKCSILYLALLFAAIALDAVL